MTDLPQDLEQLKQQLYVKIQANAKPEQPPSDVEMLKYSELPSCQSHQNLKQQTERQWQQAPMQGAIPMQSPFTPADEQYLIEILTECRTKLESALQTAQGYSQLPDLAMGIGDAITGIREAAAVVIEPEAYLE